MIYNGIKDVSVYTDFSEINRLKSQASKNPDEALEKVARQFESLFTQTLLKNMRDTQFSEDSLFDNDQSRMYQDLFDKQLANNLSSKKGIGLADMMIRQLSRNPVVSKPQLHGVSNTYQSVAAQVHPAVNMDISQTNQSFINNLKPLASKVEEQYKIPATVLLAQAALETGWGKQIPLKADGASSHNLFGIKAGHNWDGDVVTKPTTEYFNNEPSTINAAFKSYSSYKQSIEDYAGYLSNNKRYESAFEYSDNPIKFVQAIHSAGYATDPEYSNKISNIIKYGLP